MLKKMDDLPFGLVGVEALGTVSKADYEQVLEPLLDGASAAGRHVRFLYRLGPEFEGFTAGAAWEDAKVGLRSLRVLDGCAVITDVGWIRNAAAFFGALLPCPMRVFAADDTLGAVAWLGAL